MKTWPIIRREYLERVRSKAFIISTVLIPVLMGLMFLIPLLTEQKVKSRQTVAVVDATGRYYAALERRLHDSEGDHLELMEVPVRDRDPAAAEADLQRLVGSKMAAGGIVLPPDFETSLQARLYTHSVAGGLALETVKSVVRRVLVEHRLAAAGLPDSVRTLLQARPRWEELSVGEKGEARRQNTDAAYLVAVILIMMLYISMLMYGQQTLTGVIEEKTNRVVEVLLASVPANRLMLGKVVGIGAAGLTQAGIWVLAMVGLSAQGSLAGELPLDLAYVTPLILVSFIVFYLLGFLMYASLYAGVGALCNTVQEAQPFAGPIAMFLVIPIMLLVVVTRAPDSPLALVLSLVPLFSPMLMFMRICIQTPPLWQIGLSWVLVAATVLLLQRLGGKLYRVGILMHGAAPSWRTVLQVLRQPD